MIRVHVICEGQTEEMFVNQVMAEPLLSKGIYLYPSLIGRPGHKGGNFKYERLLLDLKQRLLGDVDAYCTTFFDFYGLPEAFPGKSEALTKTTTKAKSDCVLSNFLSKLEQQFEDDELKRFIPYIQMHEFEGLLFSDPQALAEGLYNNVLSGSLKKIRDNYESPECINNSKQTAPSKRLISLMPDYDKVIHGSLAGISVGLDKMRQECHIFDGWLTRLEQCGVKCV